MNGFVTHFDDEAGLGVVTSEAGDTYPFHCTQIAGGTRTIAVNTRVAFIVKARPKGPEAYEVTAVLVD